MAWFHFVLGLAFMASTQAGTYHLEAEDKAASVIACGVSLSVGSQTRIVPSFEASAPLSGSYRLAVTARSGSNTNTSMQANAFSGSTLPSSQVILGPVDRLDVRFEVSDAAGTRLCSLDGRYPEDFVADGDARNSTQDGKHA